MPRQQVGEHFPDQEGLTFQVEGSPPVTGCERGPSHEEPDIWLQRRGDAIDPICLLQPTQEATDGNPEHEDEHLDFGTAQLPVLSHSSQLQVGVRVRQEVHHAS